MDTLMPCDAVQVIKYVDGGSGINHLHFFSDELERNTVIVFVFIEAYMAIFHHRDYRTTFKFIAELWQWLKNILFQLNKFLFSTVVEIPDTEINLFQ